jgi:tetratricopeptide (TPR) repeat protein
MTHLSRFVLLCMLGLGAGPLAANEMADAQALLKQGNATAALERVEARIAARPADAQARFLKGVILTELKRDEEAKKTFRQLTADFPEFAEPYNNLAVLYAAAGDFDNARQSLEMAIRVNPKYATAYENLGDIYAQLARGAYDKAATLTPGSKLVRTKLQLARQLTGNTTTIATQ